MKKFLSFLAVATFVVALSSCGSKTEAPAEGTDSTTVVAETPAVDSTMVAVDTTVAATGDTTAAK